MTDTKKPLQDEEVAQVNGGIWDIGLPEDDAYEPYTNENFPVSCPKCNSRNIWYRPGLFGIEDLERYWCKDCDNLFGYDDLPVHGASCGW